MKRLSLLVVVASSISTTALAADVTTIDGSQGWLGYGFSGGGTASIDMTPSNDADGSLRMTGDRSRVGFGTGGDMGTLGALSTGNVSFDFYRDGASTGAGNYQIAFAFFVRNAAGQTGSLTWEGAYNGIGNVNDTWFNDQVLSGSGVWWIRSGGVNFAEVANMKTLADWTTQGSVSNSESTSIVLGTDTAITGIELKVGSGVPGGTFLGNADDIRVQFTGGADYMTNFQAVPEPMTMSILGLGALALLRKRKQSR